MVLMAGVDLPSRAIREQAIAAIDLIIQVKRYEDGVRRVQSISELVGMEGETPQLQEIFHFVATGKTKRKITGKFVATGVVPRVAQRLRDNHVDVPMHLFQASPRSSNAISELSGDTDRSRSW
jgi:pilus assembly protein CpaF